MRNFSALLLTAALFCSAYSSTVTMPSRTGVGFAANGTFHDSAAFHFMSGTACNHGLLLVLLRRLYLHVSISAIALASKRAFTFRKSNGLQRVIMGNPAKTGGHDPVYKMLHGNNKLSNQYRLSHFFAVWSKN